jgi:uncharacterized protein YdaT
MSTEMRKKWNIKHRIYSGALLPNGYQPKKIIPAFFSKAASWTFLSTISHVSIEALQE